MTPIKLTTQYEYRNVYGAIASLENDKDSTSAPSDEEKEGEEDHTPEVLYAMAAVVVAVAVVVVALAIFGYRRRTRRRPRAPTPAEVDIATVQQNNRFMARQKHQSPTKARKHAPIPVTSTAAPIPTPIPAPSDSTDSGYLELVESQMSPIYDNDEPQDTHLADVAVDAEPERIYENMDHQQSSKPRRAPAPPPSQNKPRKHYANLDPASGSGALLASPRLLPRPGVHTTATHNPGFDADSSTASEFYVDMQGQNVNNENRRGDAGGAANVSGPEMAASEYLTFDEPIQLPKRSKMPKRKR